VTNTSRLASPPRTQQHPTKPDPQRKLPLRPTLATDQARRLTAREFRTVSAAPIRGRRHLTSMLLGVFRARYFGQLARLSASGKRAPAVLPPFAAARPILPSGR
jgi:hypothetical protein